MSDISFFAVVIMIIVTERWEYALLFIPIFLLSNFFGGLECPDCKSQLHMYSRSRSRDKINYCSQCGFDFSQELPKVWARLDKDNKESKAK
jgi:Zn ribbon nucleic-acid-binding protein